MTNVELGQHVLTLNEAYKDKGTVHELADCRYLTDVSEMTGGGAAFAAGMGAGQKRTFNSKGAIVVASDTVYGLARAYTTFARETRIDSRVYRSIDEAIEWLGAGILRSEIIAFSDKTADLSPGLPDLC
ncbi:hypothetical protein [Mariprofundus ferrooxydans]|uniref:hypothetical protein n=1 Tax=Mariprofundus ferrooxydans TaxID=314344 RepID=UPI001F0FFF7E|nr:hypothetical protein [Mariprofundus ferrooxydans]